MVQLYEPLARFDQNYEIELALAEEITPNASGDEWTVRLQPDIVFHSGKTVNADDVIFTIQRIVNPDDPKIGASALAIVDANNLRKLDERTVRIPLKGPYALLLDDLAQYFNGIVPVDYDPQKPVGTGAFKFQSFTPGDRSVFVRNENYWREGQPYVDEVVIIDFPDDSARVNALLSGEIEAMNSVPFGQIPVIEQNSDLALLVSETGGWLPFTMRVDQAPFDDVRVRQAMRLIVDREQMIEQALAGQGRIANDLYSPFDPCYIGDELAQREQDLEQAKSLLAAAGASGLNVELVTSPVAAGVVEAAQVLAEQAKGADVTIRLRRVDTGTFYGDDYLSWVFAQDFWFTRNYVQQVGQGSFPDSPFNETHWADERFIALINEARVTLDEEQRCELLAEAQRIEWESGGYIVWGFVNNVDAHSAKLRGLEPDRSGNPVMTWGFREAHFA